MMKPDAPSASLNDLVLLVERLRGPRGCPWDREQEMADLKQYLLEECYEVMEAIHISSFDKLEEELGDLLFQIVFLAQLARERDAFGLDDVIRRIHDKMVRRHPHVFGPTAAPDSEAVKKAWWKIKQEERPAGLSLLDSVPLHLPALQRAFRLGKRVSRTGLDWPDAKAVQEKVREETRELDQALESGDRERVREEIGDLLFSLANLSRHLGQNPEEALQESNRKFTRRFQALEQRALEEGRGLETLSPREMDAWWEESKKTKTAAPPDPEP